MKPILVMKQLRFLQAERPFFQRAVAQRPYPLPFLLELLRGGQLLRTICQSTPYHLGDGLPTTNVRRTSAVSLRVLVATIRKGLTKGFF
eukprot:m.97772 g.97772  ORF g.97772 m.97772 type:complete len:89 (+) comp15059_c0_seq4:661-927(+)